MDFPQGRVSPVCGCISSGKTFFAMVSIFFMLFYPAKAYSQNSKAAEADDLTNPPVLFLGNKTLPPMIYLKNEEPIGIVVDLAKALKEHMRRPVRLKYMIFQTPFWNQNSPYLYLSTERMFMILPV